MGTTIAAVYPKWDCMGQIRPQCCGIGVEVGAPGPCWKANFVRSYSGKETYALNPDLTPKAGFAKNACAAPRPNKHTTPLIMVDIVEMTSL